VRLLAVAVLAGCYAPTVASGVPCDPKAPACPDGQSCQTAGGTSLCLAGTGDGGTSIDGSAADFDGDGVPDDQDNCVMRANPDQADEDGDGLGDVCDPCPPFGGDANVDSDGDGVGDGCDPHPNDGGDTLALFLGFSDGMPAGSQTNGAWTFANGDARVSTSEGAAATLSLAQPPSGSLSVSTGVTIDAAHGTGNARGAGVMQRFGADGSGVSCEQCINSSDAGCGALVQIKAGDVYGLVASDTAPGKSYTLVNARSSNDYTCSGSAFAEIKGTDSNAPVVPRLGLRALSMDATFHWLMVVKSP
jgi:hypothetical protein